MSLLPSKPDASPSEDAGPRVIGVDSEDADEVLSALSSETARNILAAVHDDPAPPSELAERVDTSLQNAQYHLENLEDAGAVEVVDTAYSAKGREMDVYAAADQPLVIFAGDQEDSSVLRTAIQRLVGALGVLALASLAVQALFGRELSAPTPTGQGGGDAAGGDGGGAGSEAADDERVADDTDGGDGGGGDGGDGGDDADFTGEDAGEITETPTAEPTGTPEAADTPTADTLSTTDATGTPTPEPAGTPTAQPAGTPTPQATGTPTATPQATGTPTPRPTPEPTPEPTPTAAPEPTGTPTPAEALDTVTPTPEAVDGVAGAAAGLPPGLLFFAGGAFVLGIVTVAWYLGQ